MMVERLTAKSSASSAHVASGYASTAGNKWVPHELTETNRTNRIEKCVSLLSRHKFSYFLDRIVTCDEKWIFYDNVVRQRSWCAPGEPPLTTPKRDIHSSKLMLCIWWNMSGVVHYEFLPRNQTINTDLYCEQLDRVQQKLLQKHPSLVNQRGVCFQQDNARPHVSARSLTKISELNWELLPHPPYSPDLAPSDYHLFRSLEHFLRGKKLSCPDEIKQEVENFIASKQEDFFKQGIEKLVGRWEKVIETGGEYIVD
jgi:histone-lysine N-methyltransferase SETMAR